MRCMTDVDELKARLARIKRLLDELEKALAEKDQQRDVVNKLLRELDGADAVLIG